MNFKEGHLYHIFNQGNNKQTVFFSEENYKYFLKKIEYHLLPHVDILAWCLMPNHFHLMVHVKAVTLTHGVTLSHPVSEISHPVSEISHPVSNTKTITLNDSIAVMLRSYTRAINKRYNKSGSLFRMSTKAECITEIEGVTPSFYTSYEGTTFTNQMLKDSYPQVCFNYIHLNPVKARMVTEAFEWEFSSYNDYYNLRDGYLINRELARNYELI